MKGAGDGHTYAANCLVKPCQIPGCTCGAVMIGLLDEDGQVIAIGTFLPDQQARFLEQFKEQMVIAASQNVTQH